MSARPHGPLQEAMQLVISEPARAEALCRQALAADPKNIEAEIVLIEALRRQSKLAEARAEAEPFAAAQPDVFGAQRLLGLVLNDAGEHRAAAAALGQAAALAPNHPYVWRELGDAHAAAGDIPGSQAAYLQHARMAAPDPRVAQASALFAKDEAAAAKTLLDAYLGLYPSDVAALGLLAQAHARLGDQREAEATLRRALQLAPGYNYARRSLCQLLIGVGRYAEALHEAEAMHAAEPGNPGPKTLLASVLAVLGDFDRSIALYRELLDADPADASLWIHYGHSLKAIGRATESARAYQRAIELAPQRGEAYWSLANLKTYRFSAGDIAQIQRQLRNVDLPENERVNMLFALGKAHEQLGEAGAAFKSYSEGARLYRGSVSYDSDAFTSFVERSRKELTAAFFSARADSGDARADPIFVVGLPRSGSTLVEQILASHSSVEATMELGEITSLARSLAADGDYLEALPDLDSTALAALGARYLENTRIHRKLGKPRFIDKMPNNFAHAGFIHLILPNAKIIDVRRHPMACGWSCFKQHWAMGQLFTYDLADLGRYYRDYVALMAHYDAALPARVHRVIYEDLVRDPQAEIRKLIAYCDLPFEEAVLRPHESSRSVRTPSAEQVRQPISDKGLDDWRPYESYLQPLKEALGDVLSAYPSVPA